MSSQTKRDQVYEQHEEEVPGCRGCVWFFRMLLRPLFVKWINCYISTLHIAFHDHGSLNPSSGSSEAGISSELSPSRPNVSTLSTSSADICKSDFASTSMSKVLPASLGPLLSEWDKWLKMGVSKSCCPLQRTLSKRFVFRGLENTVHFCNPTNVKLRIGHWRNN